MFSSLSKFIITILIISLLFFVEFIERVKFFPLSRELSLIFDDIFSRKRKFSCFS